MPEVIVQLEGHGAMRVAAHAVPDLVDHIANNGVCDVYVTDRNGNVWAPCNDSWVLWEASEVPHVTDARVVAGMSPEDAAEADRRGIA